MRWGRSIRVVAAVLAAGLIGGASASASDATAPVVTAQAVVIDPKGAPAVGSPAAALPGSPTVTVTDWSSPGDQPMVTLASATGSAASVHGARSGTVELGDLAIFGGEIRLHSLTLAASSAGSTIDLKAQGLEVDGTAVDLPAADESSPVGDWGTLTAGYQNSDSTGRTAIGLVITLRADHDGLPAGSTIGVGVITLAAPPSSGGDGGGGGGGDNGGGAPTPTPTHHHHHRHQTGGHTKHEHGAQGGKGHHHRVRHVKVTHPKHLPQLGRGLRGRVIEAAAEQIGWPYVWGGESRAEGGFDCSGLVDYAYAAAGHPLAGRPTAAVLWQMGVPITADQLRPGDLAFLGAPSGQPYHVALYAGNGMVIVASGRGRPIAEQPLDSAPWDGFARIWAPGAGPLLKHARWLTAAVPKQSPPVGLRSDVIAAARASRTPPVAVKPARTRAQSPAAPPKRDPSPDRGSGLVTVADLRLRLEQGVRAALGLPTA
ncbi:MAG TPA: C40 family peptidase [Gaiellales bacterium]